LVYNITPTGFEIKWANGQAQAKIE
jgi:hypothetical protein